MHVANRCARCGERAGGFHRHDRTEGWTRLVRRRRDRSPGCENELFLHADLRPEGTAASGFRTSLTHVETIQLNKAKINHSQASRNYPSRFTFATKNELI